MSALGRHILAEFYGCPPETLCDLELIKAEMVKAAGVSPSGGQS